MIDVDSLANEIRRVDGAHSLGAGALAEALMPFVTAHLSQPQPVAQGEAVAWQRRDRITHGGGDAPGWSHWREVGRYEFAEHNGKYPHIEFRELYATPTIPTGHRVVPDAKASEPDDHPDAGLYIKGWNDCRDALLAASPSAGGV